MKTLPPCDRCQSIEGIHRMQEGGRKFHLCPSCCPDCYGTRGEFAEWLAAGNAGGVANRIRGTRKSVPQIKTKTLKRIL